MASPIAALTSGASYMARNPTTLLRMARHALSMRIAVPLDLVRWALQSRMKGDAVSDLVVDARPPALTIAATVNVMGAKLRAGTGITVEEVRLGPDELVFALRLSGTTLQALDGEQSPMGQLIKSGAIDPSKPANMLNFMPKRPAILTEAKDDRFVLDLLKIRKLAENGRLRAALASLRPIVTVREVRTEGDSLLLGFTPHPTGVPAAISALISALRNGI
jgi:hypothetical protein